MVNKGMEGLRKNKDWGQDYNCLAYWLQNTLCTGHYHRLIIAYIIHSNVNLFKFKRNIHCSTAYLLHNMPV